MNAKIIVPIALLAGACIGYFIGSGFSGHNTDEDTSAVKSTGDAANTAAKPAQADAAADPVDAAAAAVDKVEPVNTENQGGAS